MAPGYGALALAYDRLNRLRPRAGLGEDEVVAALGRLLGRQGALDPWPRGDGAEARPLVLDLGCGSGELALALQAAGLDVVAVDGSPAMLQQAQEKERSRRPDGTSPILWLCQDISRFELFGTVDAIVCMTDTLNHITDSRGLERLFRLCANYLNPGAPMLFDVLTRAHFTDTLGGRVRVEADADAVLCWTNRFRPRTGLNRADLTFFLRRDDGLYERGDETVRERLHSLSTLRSLARRNGLVVEGVYGERFGSPPGRRDRRRILVLRQSGKREDPTV